MSTPWTKRAYNLGLKAVPNFEALSKEVIAYYEQNLDQIPVALARGFIIEQASDSTEKPVPLLSVVETFELGSDVISTLSPSRRATFAEWAATVLGVSPDTTIDTLEKLLKKRGHTMTSAQVEKMRKTTDCGEKTGMCTDGWANFYFIENGDGSVSVGNTYRDGHDWYAYVFRLDNDFRWYADDRLLVRNLDASKL